MTFRRLNKFYPLNDQCKRALLQKLEDFSAQISNSFNKFLMEKDRILSEIVKTAKEYASSSPSERKDAVEEILRNYEKLLEETFQNENNALSEEDFIQKQTYLQYITVSLTIVTSKQSLNSKNIRSLLSSLLTSICAVKDAELSGSFDRILSVVIVAAGKLDTDDYDRELESILDVVRYCQPGPPSSVPSPCLLSPRTLARVINDSAAFFKAKLTENIIGSVFGAYSDGIPSSDVFIRFWPHCLLILNDPVLQKDSWNVSNCLRAGLRVLQRKREKDSVVEQANFISELFSVLVKLTVEKQKVNSVISKVFEDVKQFILEHEKVLTLKKELREKGFEWLHNYMQLISDYVDEYGFLDTFSEWMVCLTASQDVLEVSGALCAAPMRICIKRIKLGIQSGTSDCLHNYLDILVALFKIARIQNDFKWLLNEVQKQNSLDNYRWPRLLKSLLSVQHPICQQLCRKFAPSVESLWAKIKSGDSSRSIVNSLAIVVGSCHFLSGSDDNAKQIIPILLLPCFRDFKTQVGSKWDSFRLAGAGRVAPTEFADLEKYTQVMEHGNTEITKLRAVTCALQMEKKTGKYVALVADMALAVLTRVRTDKIVNCLPALNLFLTENPAYVTDFVNILVGKLCENHQMYTEKTLIEMCRSIKMLICFSANRKSQCSKCQKNTNVFVAPDTGEMIKLDEQKLALFLKAVFENQSKNTEKFIRELLEMSRSILLHVESPRLATIFFPVVKALEVSCSEIAPLYFRVWELISLKSTASKEKRLQVYIPVMNRLLSATKDKDPELMNQFMKNVLHAKLSKTVKIVVFASLFAHAIVADNQELWIIRSIWTSHFARKLINKKECLTEQELLQAVVKRYATVFTRCFVGSLLFESGSTVHFFDESRTRELVRTFVSQVTLNFQLPNLISALLILRPSLLYWSLISGARGQNPKIVCSVIDFLCQELVVASTSTAHVPVDPCNAENVMKQRNALITEMFQNLVQLWAFETCKGNESIWKFCAEHCSFTDENMKYVTSVYRKDIFECLLLVSPEDFDSSQDSTPIVMELRKTYENAKKGEKFCLETATRDRGTEIFFAFRTYFTSDIHFWMRERAAVSFRYVLQHVKLEFFEANWYSILSTLRYSPLFCDATRLSWMQFADRVSYSVLRNNLWRIMTDVARVSRNQAVVDRIWLRLIYSKNIEALTTDTDIVKFFWVLPLEVEKKQNFHLQIATSRKLDDAFEFIANFRRYPSLSFIDHLSSKLERGAVWKDDLPRLIGALTRIIPYCQTKEQRDKICGIVQKNPILNSEYADIQFLRWDNRAFYATPTALSKAVLDECAWVVETMVGGGRIEHADRTMCEVFRCFTENEKDSRRKSWLEGLKDMYAKMNKRKPNPEMFEQKTIDELGKTGRFHPFAQWLTILILNCAKMTEDASLASLIPIAHINDTNFLAKLAMRFILPVVFLERGGSQWILATFEDALTAAYSRKTTSSERGPAAFIFFVFDFLYIFLNSEDLRKKKSLWECVTNFWKSMMQWTVKDDYEHEQPLIVKVAELFGMEKRCILWLEMFMELRKKNTKGEVDSGSEAAYYFTLMNLYARLHELNGVRGAYAQLSKVQIDHVYGKICIREAFGEVASAANLAGMTEKGTVFDPSGVIRKMIEEHNAQEYQPFDMEEHEEQIHALKQLTQWVEVEKDIGPSPHVFERTIEARSIECKILNMIREGEEDEKVNEVIDKARETILERLAENALGGDCSYETSTPFLVQIQMLDEICKLKNASVDDLIDFDTEFWKSLHKRTDNSEQRMDVLEPILRVRRSLLTTRKKTMADRDRKHIEERIVEAHLQSARIARLTGCHERAQLAIINAKKVLPYSNKIVLEEAKLQLQSSDELSGMRLLDSILEKTFRDLSKHYGDTQQNTNLTLQTSARGEIERFPAEQKNLFSSVQMLRISHMIKAGNTISFEKIYNETTNLLQAFVSSGVMYEAAWLLDYLFHYNERNRPVLPLLKAYKEVANFETNHVLRARAVERMMSLWLSNTRKINSVVASSKVSNAAASEMVNDIKSMNREISSALERIGWQSFYPAYAVLARHIDHQDEDVFRTIKSIMQQLILRLPHQCMWQSVYLLRQDIAEVKKRYMEVLSAVKRRGSTYVTLIDQYDYASAVFNQVPEKVDSDHCSLSEKVEGLKTLLREKKYDPKELIMDRRGENECKAVFGIMVPIRSVIDGSVLSEDHSADGYTACTVPDRYLIHDFSDKVKVLQSKTKPVLIELITMEGRKVRLICKKEDDLTKDYHFTKMVEMCNDLLIKDEQTRIQNMSATTYSVIPLAKQGGIIEFMEGVIPFYETLNKLMGKTSAEWTEAIQRWASKMKTLNKEDKAAYFRDECCAQTPLVMGKWFRLQFPEAGKWFASRKLFAKSSAVMSMIGYIFGLGDRHTKNLMVHVPTGKCVHVDFDMIFNRGELLGTPEVVPFRLTRNMINGMGEVALEGEFRTVCEQTLRVFRENSYEIEKYIADLPNLVSDFNLKDFDMTVAKRLISGRLRGQIMTAKLYRSNPISHPMQVSQLASSLIELATSDEKLCEMFEGWMPTL